MHVSTMLDAGGSDQRADQHGELTLESRPARCAVLPTMPSASRRRSLLARDADCLDSLARVPEQCPHSPVLWADDRGGVGRPILRRGRVPANTLDRRLSMVAQDAQDIVHDDAAVALPGELA